MTEDELVLLLSREAGEEGSDNDLIKKFREKYRDQSELITMASQGGFKSTRAVKEAMWARGHHRIGYRGASKETGWLKVNLFLCLILKRLSRILKVIQISLS